MNKFQKKLARRTKKLMKIYFFNYREAKSIARSRCLFEGLTKYNLK